MIDSAETAFVVRQVNHPAIKMQLDTGAIIINKENINDILQQDADIIGHIHLSEPDLAPLGCSGANHTHFANALYHALPNSIATIEMLDPKNKHSLSSIEDALDFAISHYRQ